MPAWHLRADRTPRQPPVYRSSGALVEEIVNLAGNLGVDAGNLGEIGRRGVLDRLQSPEMLQQRAFAARADAGNFLQPRLPDIAPTAGAVRADGEAVRLVAQPFHE